MKISSPVRKAWIRPLLLLQLSLLLGYYVANTQQSVRDTIFVSSSSVTELVFREPSEARIVNGNGSYQVRGGTKTSIQVSARRKAADPQLLVVTEGGREHHLIVAYKEDAKSQRVELIATGPSHSIDKPNVKLVTPKPKDRERIKQLLDAGNRHYEQEDWARAKESYIQIAGFKFKEQPVVSQRLQEIDAKLNAAAADLERRFNEALNKAEQAIQNKKYREAADAYKEAIVLKPGAADIEQKIAALLPLIAKQQEEQDALLILEWLKKGEQEEKARRYLAAETEYLKVIEKAPKHSLALKRLKEIGKRANEERYLQQKKTGDSLFRVARYEDAKTAYQVAIKAKPNDSYIIAQLKKVRAREVLVEKRTNYSLAIVNADKALSGNELNAALAEYQRAQRIFPDSAYPARQIARIDQMRKGAVKPTAARQD